MTKPANEPNDKLSFKNLTSTFPHSPLCRSSCITCSSPYLQEIHKWRYDDKMYLKEISAKLEKEFGEKISYSALHRHFTNFNKNIKRAVETKMIKYLEKDVDQRAQHSAKLTTLINAMFDKLAQNWQDVAPTIENLEKLTKLRYLVMENKISMGDYDEQINLIIKNAEKVDARQLSLFSPEAITQKPDEENRGVADEQ